MQQTTRAVETLNADPKWPQGYLAELQETGAQEKNILYCVARVDVKLRFSYVVLSDLLGHRIWP